MGTRVFHSPETGALRAVPAFELRFVPIREASVLQFPHTQAQEKDWPEESPACFRGVRFALAIEAAAALMIYGLWHLSHLVR